MDYLKLLEQSYECAKKYHGGCPPESKLEYLGDYIFDFTTYDDGKSVLFATYAVALCLAVTEGTTFEYITSSDEHYTWYLLMCNMPFFKEKLEWGASIRGARWKTGEWAGPNENKEFILKGWNLWDENENQIDKIDLNGVEWVKFIRAVIKFALPEAQANNQEVQST